MREHRRPCPVAWLESSLGRRQLVAALLVHAATNIRHSGSRGARHRNVVFSRLLRYQQISLLVWIFRE